jgi:hypothetical protein
MPSWTAIVGIVGATCTGQSDDMSPAFRVFSGVFVNCDETGLCEKEKPIQQNANAIDRIITAHILDISIVHQKNHSERKMHCRVI